MINKRYWEDLEQDLIELESTDPDIAAAAHRLDETRADILRRAPRGALAQRAEIEDIGRTWGAP
jgi:hypothetical protein